jgi:hypothetical protein
MACAVVVAAPGFDQAPGFLQRIENLSIQELIPQSGIKTFDVAT